MIDRLYDELDETRAAWFDEHLESCNRCASELSSLARTRAAVSELPELEPPASVSAILLHEAAKRAPAGKTNGDEDSPTLFGRITAWLFPVLRHPAAAAVAVLVLVAGVAGSLYLRGEHRVAEPEVSSAKSEAKPGADGLDLEDVRKRITAKEDVIDKDYRVGLLDDQADPAAAKPEEKTIDVGTVQPTPKSPVPDTARTSRAHLRDGERQGGGTFRLEGKNIGKKADKKARKKVRKKVRGKVRGPAPNAISGADELVFKDNKRRGRAKGSSSLGSGGAPGKLQQQKLETAKPNYSATPARVINRGATGHYTMSRDPKAEARWAQNQQQLLWATVKRKKCLAAARIANDIRDRNPGYFQRNINGSKNLRPCAMQVSRERSRRIRDRAARAGRKARTKSGASAPKSKRAAPRKAPAPDFNAAD